jgi:hypothetical protein
MPDPRQAAPAGPALASDSSAEAASANALDSGLTEIALALAMAFFSIMVLAMISLSVPPLAGDPAAAVSQDAAGLVVAASTAPPASEPPAPAAGRRLVVLHDGRFLDAGMAPLDPASLDGPAILAIAPGLTLEQAIAARGKLAAATDVIVSTLDERWLDRLATQPQAENRQ